MDVSGLTGRAPGASIGPLTGRPAVVPAPVVGSAGIDVALDDHEAWSGDTRSISEPPGLTFSAAGLSPGRTSRFVADL